MKIISNETLRWLEIILNERFGNFFEISVSLNQDIYISINGKKGAIIFPQLDQSFYLIGAQMLYKKWSAEAEGWKSVDGRSLPMPYSLDVALPIVNSSDENLIVNYNILGLIYWTLNRLEEINSSTLDKHGRFPAVSSHAFRFGYLERPIIDEWLNILQQIILKQWPDLILKIPQFRIQVSHDVDTPSLYAFKSMGQIFRILLGHIIKRKSFKLFYQALCTWLNSSKKIHALDPANTFDWIMDLSESNNITSAFYFICGKSNSKYDADYDLEHPAIRALLKKIELRRHEIGLHPSYEAYLNPGVLFKEAAYLKKTCNELGIKQSKWGGRMHYLRWSHPKTLDFWEEAQMDYDSTLGYADSPGFRCGTCFEYRGFNPITQKILNIKIRPLIAMESSIIDGAYLGLGETKKAVEKFIELGRACKKVHGGFTLLWHNSELVTESKKNMYKEILSGI